jgi:hypothetical protein
VVRSSIGRQRRALSCSGVHMVPWFQAFCFYVQGNWMVTGDTGSSGTLGLHIQTLSGTCVGHRQTVSRVALHGLLLEKLGLKGWIVGKLRASGQVEEPGSFATCRGHAGVRVLEPGQDWICVEGDGSHSGTASAR